MMRRTLRPLFLIAAAMAVFLAACGDDNANGIPAAVEPPPGILTIPEAIDQIETLEGQEVTVAGQLGRGLEPHVAVLDGALYETQDILLVSTDADIGLFPIRAPVRATGTIVRLDIAEAEERLGIDLDPTGLEKFSGRVSLLADDMLFILSGPGLETLALELRGQQVSLVSEVQEVFSDRLVSIGDGAGDDRTLILLPVGLESVDEDTLLQASGVVRVFTLDLLSRPEFALNDLAARDRLEAYEGAPLIIAGEAELTP